MPLPSGSKLGPYRIVAPLGAGGMGEVYRAHDERLGRDLALKVLPSETMGDETARARLIREARTASSLNHPHIAHIYEVGEDGDRLFIAMELVDGRSLRDLIQAGGIPPESVVPYARQIAEALAYAHRRGVIHRDLKSANVMVTPEGWVKVLDFGLAKRAPGAGTAAWDRDPNLTVTGLVLGTPNYLPPEVLVGGSADARSDVWALGVVLYEMATGKVPFLRSSVAQLADAIVNEAPAPVSGLVPVGLKAVIDRCLAKEPAARYPSADEARAALEALDGRVHPRPARTWRRLAVPAAVLLLALATVLALGIGGVRLPGLKPADSRITSLAVLPLANLSGDPAQEYFADGMTEELITDLASIQSLTVISRTSAMKYKDSKKSLREIARALDVDAIVEGSVLRAGDRVRITAQLIEAARDRHLWARSYERDFRDVLALQSDVARDIAQQIEMQLSAQESSMLAEHRRVNPDAYDLYLKGRHEWSKLTEEGVRKGIEYYERALALDPDDARYTSGLADAYLILIQVLGAIPPREGMPKVKEYARQALRADEQSAEAHASMAAALFLGDWKWAEAERHVRRAIELKPGYSTGHVVYSVLLQATGRLEEALEHDRRAEALDPLSLVVNWNSIWTLFYARRYDEARTKAERVAQMYPTSELAHGMLFRVHEARGDYALAVRVMDRHMPMTGEWRRYAETVQKGLAASGPPGYWRGLLEQFKIPARVSRGSYTRVAMIHAQLGDRDRAIHLLERAFEERAPDVLFIGMEPLFDPLRSDPRFQAIIRRIGLTPSS